MTKFNNDLLAAETTLRKLTEQMADEYQASQGKWPRAWMQKHTFDRVYLIKARQILVDRAKSEMQKTTTPPKTPEIPVETRCVNCLRWEGKPQDKFGWCSLLLIKTHGRSTCPKFSQAIQLKP